MRKLKELWKDEAAYPPVAGIFGFINGFKAGLGEVGLSDIVLRLINK
jgi:hypothetical protein